MTFYQKLEILCKNRGTNVTALTRELGFSSSAGTTWKKSKGLPRNSTLKKIADYFGISVDDLEDGIIDYDAIDTDAFNQSVWTHLLEKHDYDERAAIDAYLDFEQSQMRDATSNRNTVNDNHGIVGNANAPVTIVNHEAESLTEQEKELLNMFRKLSVMKQAQLLVSAAEMLNQQ